MTLGEHRGIPTTYNSQLFRSLVEARWASFFDVLGWPWEYEPFELKGYIPDFALKFHKPILVEVKSELEPKKLKTHRAKIDASGWNDEYLIVGASLFRSEYSSAGNVGVSVGWLGSSANPNPVPGEFDGLDNAILCRCGDSDLFTINQASMEYWCRRHGDSHPNRSNHWKDLDPVSLEDATHLWRFASNRVQWKAR
jgi:hypothetical protein